MPEPTVTVAIPLHRSRPWIDNVVGNVERLAGHARLLISDADEQDDTLDTLRQRLQGVACLDFIGRRALVAGWPSHMNDLLARTTTPYAMWLAHDDEIASSWVAAGAAALDRDTSAVLAVGPIEGIGGPSEVLVGFTRALDARLASPSAPERLRAAMALAHRDGASIGFAFRGVFRTPHAMPIPIDIPGDRYADIYWVLGMLSRGPFAALDVDPYRKRFRSDGTHQQWGGLGRREAAEHVRQILRAAWEDQPRRDELVDAAWDGDQDDLVSEVAAYRAGLARARCDLDTLAARERELEADVAEARAAAAYWRQVAHDLHVSRSWRWTRPLRWLSERRR